VLTLCGAAVALGYGYRRVDRIRWEQTSRAAETRQALMRAQELLEAGEQKRGEALAALRAVVHDFEGRPESHLAARWYRELEGTWFDRQMREIAVDEGRGRYGRALDRAEALLDGLTNRTLRQAVEERQALTQRLAWANYSGIREKAARRLEQGDREGALALYGEAIERIGTPEVVADAQARMREIEQLGAGSSPTARAGVAREEDAAVPEAATGERKPAGDDGTGDEPVRDEGDEEDGWPPEGDFEDNLKPPTRLDL
jgi:hypothetical protein